MNKIRDKKDDTLVISCKLHGGSNGRRESDGLQKHAGAADLVCPSGVQHVYFQIVFRWVVSPERLNQAIELVIFLTVEDFNTGALFDAFARIFDEIEQIHGCERSNKFLNELCAFETLLIDGLASLPVSRCTISRNDDAKYNRTN